MATGYNGENFVNSLAPSFLIRSSSFLQASRTTIISLTSSKFGQIRPWTAELAALERLEKYPYTYKGENVVNTLAPSFLSGSSSFLQVIRTTISVRMNSKFGQIRLQTAELAALELLKMMYIDANTLAPSFSIGSSSILQVIRTTSRSRMSSKFSQIGPWTAE